MKFEIIDTKTKKPVNFDDLLKEDWLKNANGVFYCDFDNYYINSDCQIILLDDCGNAAYPPVDRLKFVPEDVSEWIPVKERLPEKDGIYICTILTHGYYTEDGENFYVGHNPHYYVNMCYFKDGVFPSETPYENYNVIAWMNVPNAYKESDNDE